MYPYNDTSRGWCCASLGAKDLISSVALVGLATAGVIS